MSSARKSTIAPTAAGFDPVLQTIMVAPVATNAALTTPPADQAVTRRRAALTRFSATTAGSRRARNASLAVAPTIVASSTPCATAEPVARTVSLARPDRHSRDLPSDGLPPVI